MPSLYPYHFSTLFKRVEPPASKKYVRKRTNGSPVLDPYQTSCDVRKKSWIGYSESLSEIILEAWGMLVEQKLWQNDFKSEADALSMLDNPLLKDLRNRAVQGRNRKQRYASEIRKNWGEITDQWAFDHIGEHYLSRVCAASKIWSFQDATVIVSQIAASELNSPEVALLVR